MLVNLALITLLIASPSLARPAQTRAAGIVCAPDPMKVGCATGTGMSLPASEKRALPAPDFRRLETLNKETVEFFDNLPQIEREDITKRMIDVYHKHMQTSSAKLPLELVRHTDDALFTAREKEDVHLQVRDMLRTKEHTREGDHDNSLVHSHGQHNKRWLNAVLLFATMLPVLLPIMEPVLNIVKPIIAPVMAPLLSALSPITSMIFPLAEQLAPGFTSLMTFKKRDLATGDQTYEELALILKETWEKHHSLDASKESRSFKRSFDFVLY